MAMVNDNWTFFASRKCNLKAADTGQEKSEVTSVANFFGHNNVIAVAVKAGLISFYNSEGHQIDTNIQRQEEPYYFVKLAWISSQQENGINQCIQLIGCRNDGQIQLWKLLSTPLSNHNHPTSKEGEKHYSLSLSSTCLGLNDNIHTSPIKFLEKSEIEDRFITVDENGIFCLWRITNKDKPIIPVTIFNFDEGVSATVMFSRCANQLTRRKRNNCTVFVGTNNGILYMIDKDGNSQEVYKTTSCISHIVKHCTKSCLLLFTESFDLVQIELHIDGTTTQSMKVKLSIPRNEISNERRLDDLIWTPQGILCAAFGDSDILCWDIEHSESFSLDVPLASSGEVQGAKSLCINDATSSILIGTTKGNCILGNFDATNFEILEQNYGWQVLSTCNLDTANEVSSMLRNQHLDLITVTTKYDVFIIKKEHLQTSFNDKMIAIQIGQCQVEIFSGNANGVTAIIDSGINIKGLTINRKHLVIWSSSNIQVYKNEQSEWTLFSDFPTKVTTVALSNETLYIAQSTMFVVTNLEGIQKLSIRFSEEEGKPTHFDVAMNYLCIATDRFLLKLMDISKIEPILFKKPTYLSNRTFKKVISLRCNADASIISMLVNSNDISSSDRSDSNNDLYLLNTGSREFKRCGLLGEDETPISQYWDPVEPRILCIEINVSLKSNDVSTQGKIASSRINVRKIMTMFVSSNLKTNLHDCIEIKRTSSVLVGINIPEIFFVNRNPDYNPSIDSHLSFATFNSVVMKHFKGLENEESSILTTILDYSYYITVNELDKAYVSIRNLNNQSLWEDMARHCVLNERIDIAELCLAHLGHIFGVGAIRRSKLEPEREVALATAATQLGMKDYPSDQLINCGRLDLYSQLKRQQGMWLESFHRTIEDDRVHEKVNHFHFAWHLKRMGEHELGLRHLEKSGVSKKYITRKMLMTETLEKVEEYVGNSGDTECILWYASYLESTGQFERAEHFYTISGDDVSRVRLFCHEKDIEKAINVVEESNNKAAAYHLARHLEAHGNIQMAVEFYTKSGKSNHAIRLSKLHGLNSDLLHIGLRSHPSQMLGCASYFERRGDLENACQLYMKAGDNKKALEVCYSILESNNSNDEMIRDSILVLIEKEMGNIPKHMISLLSIYLFKSDECTKAVELLKKNSYSNTQILSICEINKIPLNNEIVDAIVLHNVDFFLEADVTEQWIQIAHICEKQGNFRLACKKFTQGGDRIKAMKCLLRTGHTNNIISYAGAARDKEIFILAANYLQTLDWYNDQEILKSILHFYSKAKGFEQLAYFFDSWSQREIKEHHDYTKALKLAKEALKYEEKAETWQIEKPKLHLENKISTMNSFVEATDCMKNDPLFSISTCKHILKVQDPECPVQIGDCCSLMLQSFLQLEDFQSVQKVFTKMEKMGLEIDRYLSSEIISSVTESFELDQIKPENKPEDQNKD